MSAPAKKRIVQPNESNGNASDDQEDNFEQMVITYEIYTTYYNILLMNLLLIFND